MRLMTTEQVSKYHPDKYADQISDAILTAYLKVDKKAHVAVETLVKDETIVIAGEVNSIARIKHKPIVKRVAKKLNYKVTRIIDLIGKQSSEIKQAVDQDKDIGAGDQGIMFGYATRETKSGLPHAFEIANKIIKVLERDVEQNKNTILKGDAKCQVTEDLNTQRIHTILVSACHKENQEHEHVQHYIENLLKLHIKELRNKRINWIINPSGLWTIGGAKADAGLTGRKIVCDQYGGLIQVGGGAFSGKDPSKVDRSAAYMARKIAKDLIKKFNKRECLVQLAYAIGKSQPVSVYVKTENGQDQELLNYVMQTYDLTPRKIIEALDLLNVDYEKVAEGCHFYGEKNW